MIRALIVDDSALMRRLLSQILGEAGDFEIAVARNGEEALGQLHAFGPDVVTLDITMPGMDGLQCLDRMMIERPTPVVMVSSLTGEGAEQTLEALELGAVDFIEKPRGPISLEMEARADILVEKVRAAAASRLSPTMRLAERVRLRRAKTVAAIPQAALARQLSSPPKRVSLQADALVLIGSSTGGPPALERVLAPLPADFPAPLLIAQHMPANFTGALARRLDRLCRISVLELTAPSRLEAGHAYVARGNADLVVSRRRGELFAMPAPSDPELHWHPSVDRLVTSAMQHVPADSLAGILLTGMGADGARSLAELRQAGGYVIAQSEESSVVWGMPGALVAADGADEVAPVEAVADRLLAWAPAR